MPLGRSLFAALAESVCSGDSRAHDSLSMLVQSGWDIDAPGPEGLSLLGIACANRSVMA